VELFVVNAGQAPPGVEDRFDRMALAVLGEEVGQRLFAETLKVLEQVGDRPLFAAGRRQPAAGQRADDLPVAEVQTSQAGGQDLLFVSDGSVEQY
jgi:hypothetical protein